MGSVLVATEKRSGPDPALECGSALARELQMPLVVLHVVSGSLEDEERDEIEHAVSHWREVADYPITNRARSGDEAEAIVSEARDTRSPVIVIGEHQDHVIEDLFTRSTVQTLVDKSRRMVLVATPQQHRFERLLMATDFSKASRRALQVAAKLFPGATIDVVHAWHVPYEGFLSSDLTHGQFEAEVRKKAAAFVSSIGGSERERIRIGNLHLEEGETVSVICNAREKLGSQLLVIGTHGQGGLFRSAVGSIAKALLEKPPCNVLAVQCSTPDPNS